jgi:hypothetical protein
MHEVVCFRRLKNVAASKRPSLHGSWPMAVRKKFFLWTKSGINRHNVAINCRPRQPVALDLPNLICTTCNYLTPDPRRWAFRQGQIIFFVAFVCVSQSHVVKAPRITGIFFWVTEQDLCHKTEIPVAMTHSYEEYMLCYYLKCVYNPRYGRYLFSLTIPAILILCFNIEM